MDNSRLGRDDWLRAGRLALLRGGPGAVRVERLAEDLGVTKGSFYWHFTDRSDLLEALLREWEGERSDALSQLAPLHGPAGMAKIMEYIQPRVIASERGEAPSDAAIFAWAAADPIVARRVNAAEAERLATFRAVVGDRELGEFLYLAYLGFVTRRRRVPTAAAFFPSLARLTERIVTAFAASGSLDAPSPVTLTSRKRQRRGRAS